SLRDGHGLALARGAGIELGIITREKTGFAPARAAKLGISRIEIGCLDKLAVLDRWRTEMALDRAEVAYIGDDLPDLDCIDKVGCSAGPADAEPELLARVDYVASRPGGRGAVRDFIRDLILSQRVPAHEH